MEPPQTLAREALERGRRALADGDPAAALPWLDRAHRLAPHDAAVELALASALLALRDSAAEARFAALAARFDHREVWLGLISARQARGDAAGAAAALAALLAGHGVNPGASFASLAAGVARAAGHAGWCGVAAGGVALLGAAPPVTGTLDGRRWRVPADGRAPAGGGTLHLTLRGRDLLGSPLDLDRIRRLEGTVWARDGAIEGWAWHPGDPARDPRITFAPPRRGTGPRVEHLATDATIDPAVPLARPRGFVLEAAVAARFSGAVRVLGADGQDLTGSPVDPGAPRRAAGQAAALVARAWPAMPPTSRRRAPAGGAAAPSDAASLAGAAADIRGTPARARAAPARRFALVVPVYRGLDVTVACLAQAAATVPAGTPIVVVDDATPEPALAAHLDGLAAAGRIRLLRHTANHGFPTAANAGMRLALRLPGRPDVILLNSDTLPAPGWAEALRAAVHGAADIGTATPLSNDASIVSYPDTAAPAPPPDAAALPALARLAARACGGMVVDLPTGVGFCLYLRRECLIATGLFRDTVFARGYGEENDFCIRARHLGWRHVAVPGAYVAHHGAASFGAARGDLMARNGAILERLHPGYHALIAAWRADDPLAPARHRLDAARWAAAWPAGGARRRGGAAPDAASAILITHASGGGVERVVRDRCAALRAAGVRPVLLRPVRDPRARPDGGGRQYLAGACQMEEAGAEILLCPRFALPADLPALAALLRRARPAHVELHHLLGHDPSVVTIAARLGVPLDVHVHDYGAFCPRLSLLGRERRYCGEPPPRACAACIEDLGSNLEDGAPVAVLRARSAALLAAARRIVAPSADAATRLVRHFPGIVPDIVPHEPDPSAVAPGVPARKHAMAPMPAAVGRRVCVIGAIGMEKGYEVLLACARDAAARTLPLEFTVVGHTIDDGRLLATGRVFVTGPYSATEGVALIRAQEAHVAFLPSLVPETWCFTLGEAWSAGLPAVAFDLGAQAERIRRDGRGHLLPLGLSPPAINRALLELPMVAPGRQFMENVARTTQTSPPRP